MRGPIESAFETKLSATITDWPIRYQNARFPAGVALSNGGLPVDDDGKPVPFVDAAVLGGSDSAAAGKPNGALAARGSGLLRIYLCVPEGSGTGDLDTKEDAIVAAFKRQTLFADPSTGRRFLSMDPRADDGVAAYADGARFVRQISIPFDLDYRA